MNRLTEVNREDIVGGAVVLAIGIVAILAASVNPWFSSSGVVGAAVVPGVCGIFLSILGIVQIVQNARVKTAETPVSSPERGVAPGPLEEAPVSPDLDSAISIGDGATTDGPPVSGNVRKALLAWVGVLAAALLMPYTGLLPIIGVLTLYFLLFVSRKSWWLSAIYTVCLVVAVQVIFVIALGIPLPTSPWIG